MLQSIFIFYFEGELQIDGREPSAGFAGGAKLPEGRWRHDRGGRCHAPLAWSGLSIFLNLNCHK